MNNHSRSWAASLLSVALSVLAACWALNYAAHLLLAVWPVLLGVFIAWLIAVTAWHVWRRRDYW